MSPAAEKMREHLEARELAAFLEAYEQYRDTKAWEPALTACRRAFKFDHLCALNFDQG